MTYFLRKKL